VNGPSQPTRFGSWFSAQTHHYRNDKVGAEGKNRSIKILRHIAGVVVQYGDPAAVNAGRLDGQREPMVQQGRSAGDESANAP